MPHKRFGLEAGSSIFATVSATTGRADTACYGDEGLRSVFKTAVVLSIKDCWYR
jgi:hypothetical protein